MAKRKQKSPSQNMFADEEPVDQTIERRFDPNTGLTTIVTPEMREIAKQNQAKLLKRYDQFNLGRDKHFNPLR